MNYDAVIQFFGSRSEAKAKLGVSDAALSQWKKRGVVPKLRALEVERLSKRKVKYDPAAYLHAGAV